jgi:hypothetical protein
MRRATFLTLILSGVLAAPAAAQEPAGAAHPAARATSKISVRLTHAVRVGKQSIALVDRPFLVRGRTRVWAARQVIEIHAYRNGKRFVSKKVRLRGIGRGRGGFRLWIKAKAPGKIGVTALHRRKGRNGRLASRPARIRAYSPHAGPGATGPVVDLVQRRLQSLHYAVLRTRRFDDATGRALLAFRKVNGMARVSSLDRRILHMLIAGKGAFRARFPKHGRHVEADLSRQVLALIDPKGRAFRVYPMSSGKPSTPTIIGTFHVYLKAYGTNSHGMVHSSYFLRGYAIHGYPDVPATYPASHGCLRVAIPSALSIFNQIRLGETVDVYP